MTRNVRGAIIRKLLEAKAFDIDRKGKAFPIVVRDFGL